MAEVRPESRTNPFPVWEVYVLCANSTDFGVPVLHGLNFPSVVLLYPFYRQGTSAVFSQHACLARLAGMLRMGGSVRG